MMSIRFKSAYGNRYMFIVSLLWRPGFVEVNHTTYRIQILCHSCVFLSDGLGGMFGEVDFLRDLPARTYCETGGRNLYVSQFT